MAKTNIFTKNLNKQETETKIIVQKKSKDVKLSQNIIDKISSAKTFFVNPVEGKSIEVNYQVTNNVVSGPIDTIAIDNFGIAMSKRLMKQLKLYEGDVVYFVMY